MSKSDLGGLKARAEASGFEQAAEQLLTSKQPVSELDAAILAAKSGALKSEFEHDAFARLHANASGPVKEILARELKRPVISRAAMCGVVKAHDGALARVQMQSSAAFAERNAAVEAVRDLEAQKLRDPSSFDSLKLATARSRHQAASLEAAPAEKAIEALQLKRGEAAYHCGKDEEE